MPNKPLQPVSITSPGFFGLNTQDSGVGMNPSFAILTSNSIVDKSGRIAARKGWAYTTTSGGTGSSPKMMFEFDNFDGTNTIISAGNNKIFTGETTMTEATVKNTDNSGTQAVTITADNWQFVQAQYQSGLTRSPHGYMVQEGHVPLVYHKLPLSGGGPHDHTDGFGFQRLGDVGTLPAGYSVTTFQPSCALAAFGRLWMANIGDDKLTVYYSVLLDASDLTGPGSGFINLEQVIPGDDEIVALAEHNNSLVIFCKNNIIIYNNADNIDNIVLADTVVGIGCIARDSVQAIGTDLLFLSYSGLRSLGRTIQEKSAPLRDLSKNIRDNFLAVVNNENLDNVKSVYYEPDAFYLLRTSSFIYCFDVRAFLEDGSSRVTTWDTINPLSMLATKNRRLLLGKPNGIANYTGYTDNGSTYTFTYYTPYLDFGDPSLTKFPKKMIVTVLGSNVTFDVKWAFDYSSEYSVLQDTSSAANVAEYGIAEYNIAEYSSSIAIEQLQQQLNGNGNIIQIGIEALINGNAFSVQKLDIYSVIGRII